MTEIILPAFIDFPEEGAIIGRLLAGYGELEFDLCQAVGQAKNDFDVAYKVMFRTPGEKARIDVGDALGRTAFTDIGLGDIFSEAVADAHYCRKIRNKYAHCHWTDDYSGKLGFVVLADTASKNQEFNLAALPIYHVDTILLNEQEAYFKYVQREFTYINHEAQKMAGRISSHVHSRPKKVGRPEFYIP